MRTFKLNIKYELFCIVRLYTIIRKLLIFFILFDILQRIFIYNHNYISSVNVLIISDNILYIYIFLNTIFFPDKINLLLVLSLMLHLFLKHLLVIFFFE